MIKVKFVTLGLLLLTLSCQSNQNANELQDSSFGDTSSHIKAMPVKSETPVDSISSEAVQKAKKHLMSYYNSDLEKGLIDTLSRKYRVEEHDLNGDGAKEIFIGLTGPYFCGSGGCTFLLLNHDGSLNTRFTVSRNPITIAPEKTNGWNNLIIESRSNYHTIKYKQNNYPANPSTEPVAVALPVKEITKVFADDDSVWLNF